MLVLVVAKKYRLGLRMSSDDALRPGWAMQGAKARLLSGCCYGPAKAVPCYKANPFGSCKAGIEDCTCSSDSGIYASTNPVASTLAALSICSRVMISVTHQRVAFFSSGYQRLRSRPPTIFSSISR